MVVGIRTVEHVMSAGRALTGCPVRIVLLLDADGAPLATAEASAEAITLGLEPLAPAGDSDVGVVTLGEIAPPDAMLRYYFGRGGRTIMLHDGGTVREGRLETRWAGTGRAWWVELSA